MEYREIVSPLSESSAAMIATLFVASILLMGAKAVYNIYFHRLAAYPGPLYLIASDLPLAILSLLGTSRHPLKAAHEKYGAIVRIAPGTLSYIQPQAWNDIYGHMKNGGGRANFPKDPKFYSEMLLGKDTITLASDDDAIPIRRSLNAAFAHRSLLEQEPMIQEHIGRLMAQLENHSTNGQYVDIHKWFTFSAFDIGSDFSFGEDLGCVKAGVYHDWAKFIVDYFYVATLLHQCHKFWPLNRILALCIPPSMRKTQALHNESALRRIRARIAADTNRHDFIYYFLGHARKENLSMQIIEAQASVMVLGASETTSTAETGALYYILTHPDVHARLRNEIRSAFDSVQSIKLQDVLKLPYLDAVVQETLRIHTPLPNGFGRWVPDRNGAVICEKYVPQGTVVTISHYCCNTSTANFRDPMSFIPERWMGDERYANDKRGVVQPFSVGPRNCPGQEFALHNIKLTLAHLIWRFDLQIGEGTEKWAVGQRAYAGWVQPELPVMVKKR